MPSGPIKRSTIAGFWPEITTVAVCLVLLGLLHVPVIAGVVLALLSYAAFHAIARASQRDGSAPVEPPLEGIVAELVWFQNHPKVAAFRGDLSQLTQAISEGLLSIPKGEQDPGLRMLTYEMASEILGYTRQISASPRVSPEVGAQYGNLLRESTAELQKGYAGIAKQDGAALADQIKVSTEKLQQLSQELRNIE